MLGVSLGQWQTRRALEKESIERKLSERESSAPVMLNSVAKRIDDLEYRRVIVKGEFKPDWQVYLDNRPYNGAPGFYLLTPLKLAGSEQYVLVARGWANRNVADRAKLPLIATPSGSVEIQGVARRHTGRVLQLGQAEPLRPNAIVQNLDLDEFAQASGLAMAPIVVEQVSDTRDGLVRDWPRPSSGAEKHRGYAFQWYALAAMAFLFFVITGFRSGRK
jgi:cytochrome oxidase assembly protein ShyY1